MALGMGMTALGLTAWAAHASPRPDGACCATPRPSAPAPVRWARTAPARDTAVLARWRAAVGAPVLQPDPLGAGAPLGDDLVVVSWNVHVGGGDIPRLVEDLRAGRLTDGRPVRRFVLLLQEAYRSGPELAADPAPDAVPERIAPLPPGGVRRDVVADARALGLALLYVPSMRNGLGVPGDSTGAQAEDRGNAILSSLPLADASAVELPFEAQRRVPVAATVHGRTAAGAPWALRVVAAHLDNRAAWSRPIASLGGARLEQARALAAAVAGERTIVVGADLNTWSAAPLERAIPFLRGQFPSTPPDPPGGTFPVGLGITRPLDHMFFRLPDGWGATVLRVPDRYGSDHYPLLAEVAPGA